MAREAGNQATSNRPAPPRPTAATAVAPGVTLAATLGVLRSRGLRIIEPRPSASV